MDYIVFGKGESYLNLQPSNTLFLSPEDNEGRKNKKLGR
jgi:hypothetical protein